jgi:hypothetical protein
MDSFHANGAELLREGWSNGLVVGIGIGFIVGMIFGGILVYLS